MDAIDARGIDQESQEPRKFKVEAPRGSAAGIERQFHDHIVGQDEGVTACARAVDRAKSTIRSRRDLGPIMIIAELGASGSGKTEMANVMGEVLSGDPRNRGKAIRVDCGTLGGEAGKARLVGAESGYKGYGDAPAITQQKIAENAITYTDRGGRTRQLTIILFDEVEKAAPEVRETLLGPFDKKNGILQVGSGENVSFRDTIVVLTSNLGNPAAIAERRRLEESPAELERVKDEFIASGELTISDDAITARTGAILKQNSGMDQATAREQAFLELQNEATLHLAARREIMRAYSDAIAPEFRGRVDEAAVFDPIKREQLGEILDMRVADVVETFAESGVRIKLELADDLKEWLINKGYDPETNARAMGGVVQEDVHEKLEGVHENHLGIEPEGLNGKKIRMELFDPTDPDDTDFGKSFEDSSDPIRFVFNEGQDLEEPPVLSESTIDGRSDEVRVGDEGLSPVKQALIDSLRQSIVTKGMTQAYMDLIIADKLIPEAEAPREAAMGEAAAGVDILIGRVMVAATKNGSFNPRTFQKGREQLLGYESVKAAGTTADDINNSPVVRDAIAVSLREACRAGDLSRYQEVIDKYVAAGVGTAEDLAVMVFNS